MLRTMTRRSFAAVAAAAIWGTTAHNPGHADYRALPQAPSNAEWSLFRNRFINGEGRVIDTGNGNSSHSEGQGWALLMAEAHGDRATFDRVLAWTQRALKRPHDALHAWQWRPDRARPVEDGNNAADGDIFIAWALLRAAHRWQRPELRQMASAICEDLARLCIRQIAGRTVLLPAAFGFDHRDAVVVNPSYYVFPAFADFAALGGAENPWSALYNDGVTLLREARFGRWGLPPDWLRLPRAGGRPSIAPGWEPRFSYDAVRVPLYLAWAGMAREPAAAAAVAFWNQPGLAYQPAWVTLTDNRGAPYALNSGQQAVARMAGNLAPTAIALPSVAEADNYYAGALTLLSHIAMAERLPLLS
jgi:endo-1,4-beta-D-glucanase Y